MNNKYPLQWLDALIQEHLNPQSISLSQMSESDLAVISEDVVTETDRIKIRIKNEVFALRKRRQIRLLVRKYHSTFILLLDTMIDYRKYAVFHLPHLSLTAEGVIRCLEELLSFMQNRFSTYLSLDERVPITYLLVSRKEFLVKLKKLEKRKYGNKETQELLAIVIKEMKDLLSLQSRSRVTFRHILYERKLLKELEEMDDIYAETLFSMLDHKLVELNFNSPLYIDFLVKRIVCWVQEQQNANQKLSQMFFYLKEFSQLYSDERLFFNAGFQSVKTILVNWFRHEIMYLEKQVEITTALNPETGSTGNKLECDLSVDQIGLILRAADEARVVKSRSMSLVFQSIVPHLSTAFKKDLSYQSVRSKSYNAEDNDKNIAIITLEKMIKKIRSY